MTSSTAITTTMIAATRTTVPITIATVTSITKSLVIPLLFPSLPPLHSLSSPSPPFTAHPIQAREMLSLVHRRMGSYTSAISHATDTQKIKK